MVRVIREDATVNDLTSLLLECDEWEYLLLAMVRTLVLERAAEGTKLRSSARRILGLSYLSHARMFLQHWSAYEQSHDESCRRLCVDIAAVIRRNLLILEQCWTRVGMPQDDALRPTALLRPLAPETPHALQPPDSHIGDDAPSRNRAAMVRQVLKECSQLYDLGISRDVVRLQAHAKEHPDWLIHLGRVKSPIRANTACSQISAGKNCSVAYEIVSILTQRSTNTIRCDFTRQK